VAVKRWWKKWSYEIPLAFGDALWDVLVVQFADFLSRLTIRRVLEFVAIAILIMAFIQMAPIDLALLLAGDTLTYLEFLVIVRLAAGKEAFAQMLRLAARLAQSALKVLKAAAERPVAWIVRRRERHDLARRRTLGRSDDPDEERRLVVTWCGFGPALRMA
jgi:hypothetical protein